MVEIISDLQLTIFYFRELVLSGTTCYEVGKATTKRGMLPAQFLLDQNGVRILRYVKS